MANPYVCVASGIDLSQMFGNHNNQQQTQDRPMFVASGADFYMFGPRQQPVQADPYAAHRAIYDGKSGPFGYADWTARQQQKLQERIAAAKQDLGRPMPYGKMKNRDRYGQIIGGGWVTEDDD